MGNSKKEISNNLFKYATKELSQDAFLCWLVSWQNKEQDNKELYSVANKFLKKIFEKANKEYKGKFTIDEITRQEKNCDILIKLSNGYYIIIEDKIFTKEHKAGDSKEEQLISYKNSIMKSRHIEDKNNIITVYFKMIDEPEENKTADVRIERKDMIDILKKDIDNDIYRDYRNYLIELNNNIENIDEEPIVNWVEKPELFYTFEKRYKKTFKNMNISRQHGSIFIDWYYKEFKPKNNKIKAKIIFLFNDLNYDKLEIGIVLGKIENYDDDYFIKVQKRAIECLSEFEGSIVKCRRYGEKHTGEKLDTKRVCKIEMEKYLKCDKDQIKLNDLEKIMKKMQNALDKMLED